MAEKAEFNMIFDRLPEPSRVIDTVAECGFPVSVSRIIGIDNWSWEGQQVIENISHVQEILERGRIAVVCFSDSDGNEGGIFAQKSFGKYFITLWLDAARCSGLALWQSDADAPSLKLFADVLRRITEEQGVRLLLAGVGVETMFNCSGDLREIAEEAHGIDVWLTDRETAQKLNLTDGRFIEL